MTDEELSSIRGLQSTNELSVPVIRVRDKTDGRVHIVGSNPHDQLIISKNGCIYYRNMQNNETTLGGDYEFVVANPGEDYMYNEACKWYSPERFKRLSDWYKKRMKKLHAKFDKVIYQLMFEDK